MSHDLEYVIAAISYDTLLGIAGFNAGEGSLTGGMDYHGLLKNLGFFNGNWAAFVFSL